MPRTIDEVRSELLTSSNGDRPALLTEYDELLKAPPPPSARDELDKVVNARATFHSELEAIVETAARESRDFTIDEAEKRGALIARIDQADALITEREDQIRQAEKESREQWKKDAVAQIRKDLGMGDGLTLGPAGLQGVDVTEHRVYERHNGVSYMRDLAVMGFGSGLGSEWFRASERLQQHGRENRWHAEQWETKPANTAEGYFVRQMVEALQNREQYRGIANLSGGKMSYRALSTAATAGGEFVPPMYLTEQWLAYLRAGRVVANAMNHQDLPDGTMSLNIPKVTTGTLVEAQTTQNTNIAQQDIVTAFVTFPVVTVAGQDTVSLQLLDRSPISFDEVIFGDLAADHARRMDVYVINGSGASGQPTGILNTSGINTITWTQASPTVEGLYGRIGVGKEEVAVKIFRPATHLFITPNCWEYLGQSFDTTKRPLVVPEYGGPFNTVQVAPDSATAEGLVGRNLSGLATFEDANIPANLGAGTNQDVAIICRAEENYLYESPIVTRALQETYGAQLSVLLQVFNYAAFTAARYPTANSVITGTGMIKRTFNS